MYNPFSLDNKTILVTGASSGIGKATAIECSKLGAKLIITGRNEERLSETFNKLEGSGHQKISADLSNIECLSSFIEELPLLDGLVNNAGITEKIPVNFVTEEKIRHLVNINTFSPILIFSTLLKKKKLNKGASVVFVSSISGNYISDFGNSMYSLSKGAIQAFAKNAALESASKNIRVNCICPGMIDTSILKDSAITEEQLQEDAKKYPLKRYGKPEEVAYGIIYLLSNASSFVTGTDIVIDGGFILQ
ncbi:MAG: SDR family oxidoreductase [Crenarchaeota archaeon]|nr:SDR family oxidoreductase [Thermoproteota archaeon]